MHPVPHLVASVQQFAASQPRRTALTFLRPDAEEISWTWERVDARARVVAASLQCSNGTGRALILCPPGLDYVAAFLGCLYARWTAVPAYPIQDPRSHNRVQHILRDASPSVVLSTTPWVDRQREALPADLAWTAVDALPDDSSGHRSERAIAPDDVAFLQYTSGSTRTPRGVMVNHRNLLHNQIAMQRLFGTNLDTVSVSWLPPYHDMGLIGGILHLLFVGGHGWLLSPDTFLRDPLCWLETISRTRATFSGGPDFGYALCAAKADRERVGAMDLRTWKTAVHGAEPIRPSTLRRFTEAFATAGFDPCAHTPCYGLAEATLLVSGTTGVHVATFSATELSHHRALPSEPRRQETRSFVACGTCIEGHDLLVADPSTLAPCPPGHVGEILVSGPSVAPGYWANPEASAQTFQNRLSPDRPPYLRTGDLGVVHGGQVYVTGRLKDLIIVRGQNLYPQDVEAAVEDRVRDLRRGGTVAFSAPAPDGSEGLVCVATAGPRPAAGQECAALLDRIRTAILEETRVEPLSVLVVQPGTVPKTSSGKLQRSACRTAFLEGTCATLARWDAGGDDERAPNDGFPGLDRPEALQDWLASRIASRGRVHVRDVGHDTPLTSLGLDSIAMVGLLHELERESGRKLALADLWGGATVTTLAETMRAAPVNDALACQSVGASGGRFRATVGQHALWLVQQSRPRSASYNVSVCFHLTGPAVTADRVHQACRGLVARHPSLRAFFEDEAGSLWMHVSADANPEFHRTDARDKSDEEIRHAAALASVAPFDLTTGPLLRIHFFDRGTRAPVVLLTAHHIAVDFWSVDLLLRELDGLLRTPEPRLPPPERTSFEQFAAAEHVHLHDSGAEEVRTYGSRVVRTASPVGLPHNGTAHHDPDEGASHTFVVDESLTQRLSAAAKNLRTTLHTILLAAYLVVLARHSGNSNVTVGVPSAGRTEPGLASTVGYLANLLPLTIPVSPTETFADLVGRLHGSMRGALHHERIPFAAMAGSAASPLAGLDALFSFHRSSEEPDLGAVLLGSPDAAVRLGTVSLRSVALAVRHVPFDIALVTAQDGARLVGRIDYRLSVLAPCAALGLAASLLQVLRESTADPFRALGAGSLTRSPRSVVATPPPSLLQKLAQHARTRPEATAVETRDSRLTYGELLARADRLATWFLSEGMHSESPVALLLDRTVDTVVAWCAVLRAGGVLVPLDPVTLPEHRVREILEDAGVAWVLAAPRWARRLADLHRQGRARVLDRLPTGPTTPEHPLRETRAQQLAYVMYTSGTTGSPKGVMVPHGALDNLCHAQATAFGLGHDDRVLQFASPSFDASVSEIATTLYAGSSLILMPQEDTTSPDAVAAFLTEARITIATFPSSFVRMMPQDQHLPDLRVLVLAGEPIDELLAARQARVRSVLNAYGPAEAAVCATVGAFGPRAGPACLGAAIEGVRVYVLDGWLCPAPDGVVGEICLGGAGVARGYCGRAGSTAARFLPDPFSPEPGARMVRTGDLAYKDEDGRLVFVGRRDDQVKLFGVRIELGEVEGALRACEGVLDAAAFLAEGPGAQGAQLRAAIVPAREAPDVSTLLQTLRRRLPRSVVPASIAFADALPRLVSGKVDRKALATLAVSQGDSTGPAAETPTERTVERVWHTLLGSPPKGIDVDFFTAGGNSLLGARLLSRIGEETGVRLRLSDLFEAPTIRALARSIDLTRWAAGDSPEDTLPAGDTEEFEV